MSKQFLFAGFIAFLLSACATSQSGLTPADLSDGNALSLPGVDIPLKWERARMTEGESETQAGWLNRFDNQELDALVLQAFDYNPNLNRLQARLDQAKARSKKARSALIPAAEITLGGNRIDNFENENGSSANLNTGINVSWEPDLWGRLGSANKSSAFQAEAANDDFLAARQVLAAAVIENLFLTIEARRLTGVSQNNLDALNRTLGFVTVQYERGLRSGQDISLIRADVASAKVSLNSAESGARDAQRALNILIGIYPQEKLTFDATLPDVPSFAALGQPANILEQRPDIRAAQYRVRASYAAHKSSKAAQKPNLSLGGVIGGNSSSLGNLFDPAALASTFFANLAAPIFDGGARKADVVIAKADIDENLASYRETTLSAFRDVEHQIDQGQILMQQETELTHALSYARDALRFTQFRYESGESDLLNVLSVQQRVSFIEAQLVSTRRARLVQYLNLALSLGIEPFNRTLPL